MTKPPNFLARLLNRVSRNAVFPAHTVCVQPVGFPVQYGWVLIEILPSEFMYIIGKYQTHLACVRRAVDDAVGFQSVYDAVITAEEIAARLFNKVKPENLLFFFGEHTEPLQTKFLQLARPEPPASLACQPAAAPHADGDGGKQEQRTEPVAVIFCKIQKGEPLQKFFGSEQRRAGKNGEYYQVTWREFQQIRQTINRAVKHDGSISAPRAADKGVS